MTPKQILNDIVKNGDNPKSTEAQRLMDALHEVNRLTGLDEGTLESFAEAEWSLKPFGGLNFVNSFIDHFVEGKNAETGEWDQDSEQLAVILVVQNRNPQSIGGLNPPNPVPERTSNGVPICVVPVGEIEPQSGYCPGDHIARSQTGGTLGCVVTQDDNPTKGFILSNRHVMGPESSPKIGQVIHGLNSGARDSIATLFSWTQRRDPLVDAALAFTNHDLVSPIPRNSQKINPTPILTDELREMASSGTIRVTKIGAKTKETFGVVRSRDIGVAVGVSGVDRRSQIRISASTPGGLIGLSRPFSMKGDSGSLVLEVSTRRPIGLLFAGSGNTSYANLIENVIKTMKIKAFCDDSADFD